MYVVVSGVAEHMCMSGAIKASYVAERCDWLTVHLYSYVWAPTITYTVLHCVYS